MKFCHVTLTVNDMGASLRFYQDIVGLTVINRFNAGPTTEIAFLGSGEKGETQVELICDTANQPDTTDGVGLISLGFVSPSLNDTIQQLRDKGYETDGKIISPAPDVCFFFALDPDGFVIQFMKG